MAYYPDLSPYVYVGAIPGALNVGWLDRAHEFPKGKVPSAVVGKLKQLATAPTVRHRGFHCCEFCGPIEALRWPEKERRCSLVISVRSEGKIYAAPAMIAHYIQAHGYLPPPEFLRAVEEWPNNSPEPTPGSITPAASASAKATADRSAPGAPPPSAAQL